MTESRKLSTKLLLFLGSLGPVGYLPASGTVAVAVAGIPLFFWMGGWTPWAHGAALVALIFASVWLHHVGDRLLGEKDSRILVWDEVAGFAVAVAFLPFSWRVALLAFVLERALDIAKVQPARWIEKRVPGGWGVVGDDLVAGLYTRGVLQFILVVFPGWLN